MMLVGMITVVVIALLCLLIAFLACLLIDWRFLPMKAEIGALDCVLIAGPIAVAVALVDLDHVVSSCVV